MHAHKLIFTIHDLYDDNGDENYDTYIHSDLTFDVEVWPNGLRLLGTSLLRVVGSNPTTASILSIASEVTTVWHYINLSIIIIII